MFAAIGCTVGVVPHLIAGITGLAAVPNASAIAFQTRKWLGVASLLRTIRTAGLINVLNPKLTIFFVAFLRQFVPAHEPNGCWHMVGLSLAFMAVTFLMFALYRIFAAQMRARCSVAAGDEWDAAHLVGTYVVLTGGLALRSR